MVIAQIVERQSTVHSGPLPAPADFEKYDKTLPGAAERILSMAEAEQKIRIDATQALTANDTRRIHSATIVSILLVLVAGLATWLGNAWIAVPLGVIGIVGSIARTLFNWWSRGRDPQGRDFP